MFKLEKGVEKTGRFIRASFDVIFPVIGDVDLYLKHKDMGKTSKQAFWDAFPTYYVKYMAYGIFLYRTLG